MADTTIKGLIISFVIFTFMVLAIASFTSFLGSSDSKIPSESKIFTFNSTFNKFSELNNTIGNFQSDVNTNNASDTPDPNFFDKIGNTISTVYFKATTALNLLTTSFNFMDGIWGDAVAGTGLPSWLEYLPILLIIIVFSFGLVYYFTGVNN